MATIPEIQIPEILSQKEKYAPLSISLKKISSRPANEKDFRFDGIATISLFNNQAEFVTEFVSNTSPKIVQSKLGLILKYELNLQEKEIFKKANRASNQENQINFLLIVPYITAEINRLTQNLANISVMDLCGNYFIKSKNISAVRLDRPNEYRENKTIQNIYKGMSALVGRTLLESKREYDSATSFLYEVNKLGCEATLSTVSKVLSVLESDLIIERIGRKVTLFGRGIKLLQPDKLLQNLVENFLPPKFKSETRLKIDDVQKYISERSSTAFAPKFVFSGESSIQRYGIATTPQIYTIYANRSLLFDGPTFSNPFFNLVIREASDTAPFFAAKNFNNCTWAGITQTYLELMNSDKRGKELAEPLREIILKGVV